MISRHCVGSDLFFLFRVDFGVKEDEEPILSKERLRAEVVGCDERDEEISDDRGLVGGAIVRALDLVGCE
jgi:hypothetical protein